MTIFAVVLLIIFVISNTLWLWYVRILLADSARERWSLLERLRDPSMPVLHQFQNDSLVDKWVEDTKIDDEFDLVGRTDPPLNRGEDN